VVNFGVPAVYLVGSVAGKYASRAGSSVISTSACTEKNALPPLPSLADAILTTLFLALSYTACAPASSTTLIPMPATPVPRSMVTLFLPWWSARPAKRSTAWSSCPRPAVLIVPAVDQQRLLHAAPQRYAVGDRVRHVVDRLGRDGQPALGRDGGLHDGQVAVDDQDRVALADVEHVNLKARTGRHEKSLRREIRA
jgi:hypothetical protein